MVEIPDQRPIWDTKHQQRDHSILEGVPSPLAELAHDYFPDHATVLELGCGIGRDALFFASYGHHVTATDGSAVVIDQNKSERPNPLVDYSVVDMRNELPYDDSAFDVVYANLAMHYYSSKQTARIAQEIKRVLKSGGIFAFACKSYDSLHTEGEEIEPNVFVSPTGATIHLFSEDYAKELLVQNFEVKHLDEIEEEFNGRTSKIVRCVAAKLADGTSAHE
jgi:SAM-dependent methyltransferase